jgi:diacylglycerol kinase (ATP)
LRRGRTCVIVNPAAGRGRGAKLGPAIEAAFADQGADIRFTSARGGETEAARAAIEEGAGTLVVVGGDGTASNVANVILHSGRDVRMAVLPAGTGNDMAKVLGTARSTPAEVAALCSSGSTQRMDVGRVEDVYFVNCCGFGFDVAVLEGIARNTWLRGNAVYVYTALSQILGYRGLEAGVSSSRSSRGVERHLLLVIANAAYFGGAFEIAPGARAVDGELDAVSILNIAPWKRPAILAAAMAGRHERFAECIRDRAPWFDLIFPGPPVYECDGELHHARTASLRITSCPAALTVVAAGPIA